MLLVAVPSSAAESIPSPPLGRRVRLALPPRHSPRSRSRCPADRGWPLACSPRGHGREASERARLAAELRAVLRLKRGAEDPGSVVGATIATYALVVDAVIADVAVEAHRALTVGLENVDSAETRVPPPERVLARFRAAAEAQARHAAASSGATKPVVVPGRTPMDASGSPPPPAPSSSTPAAEASASNVDVYGRAYGACKATAECPICVQKTAASRFAQHLERCMGKGRVAARAAAVAGAGTGFYPGGILSRIARRDAVRREEAMKIETERRTAAEKERAEKERAVRTAAKRAKTAERVRRAEEKNASGRTGKPKTKTMAELLGDDGRDDVPLAAMRASALAAKGTKTSRGAGAGPGGRGPKAAAAGRGGAKVRRRRASHAGKRIVITGPRAPPPSGADPSGSRSVPAATTHAGSRGAFSLPGTELAPNAAFGAAAPPNNFGGNNFDADAFDAADVAVLGSDADAMAFGTGTPRGGGGGFWNPQPAATPAYYARALPGIPGIPGMGAEVPGVMTGTRAPGTSAPGMYPGMMMPREGPSASRRHRGATLSASPRRCSRACSTDTTRTPRGGVLPGADQRRRGGIPGHPRFPPRTFTAAARAFSPGGRRVVLPARGTRAPRGAAEARGAGARGGVGAGAAAAGTRRRRRRRRVAPRVRRRRFFPARDAELGRGTLDAYAAPAGVGSGAGLPLGCWGCRLGVALVRVSQDAAGAVRASAPAFAFGGALEAAPADHPGDSFDALFHADVPMDGGAGGGGRRADGANAFGGYGRPN